MFFLPLCDCRNDIRKNKTFNCLFTNALEKKVSGVSDAIGCIRLHYVRNADFMMSQQIKAEDNGRMIDKGALESVHCCRTNDKRLRFRWLVMLVLSAQCVLAADSATMESNKNLKDRKIPSLFSPKGIYFIAEKPVLRFISCFHKKKKIIYKFRESQQKTLIKETCLTFI